MDAATARSIARYSHAGQRTPRGMPVIEHVERVAAAVSDDARALAFLHDVLDHTDTGGDELLAHGLTAAESAALMLLAHRGGESFELYTLRVAHARGAEGRLARAVLLADLEDHLHEGGYEVGDPPYAWAHQQITAARARLDMPPARAGAA
jgi:hypothetical protein